MINNNYVCLCFIIVFTLTFFTRTIASSPLPASCAQLNTAGTFTLQSPFTIPSRPSSPCWDITANDVTIDGNGQSVSCTDSSCLSLFALHTGYSNIIITNFITTGFKTTILLNSTNSIISNFNTTGFIHAVIVNGNGNTITGSLFVLSPSAADVIVNYGSGTQITNNVINAQGLTQQIGSINVIALYGSASLNGK